MSKAAPVDWKFELRAALLQLVEDTNMIDKVQFIKHPHIPARLYRYRPCSNAQQQSRVVDELSRNYVRFGPASGFMDKLDSAALVDVERFTPEAFRAVLPQAMARYGGTNTFSAADQEQILKSPDPILELVRVGLARMGAPAKLVPEVVASIATSFMQAQMKASVEKLARTQQEGLRIACFCEDPMCLPMWESYATGHNGVCIEYDFGAIAPDNVRRFTLYPVFYEELPGFDATDHLIKQAGMEKVMIGLPTVAALHKGRDYSYEKEWRVVAQLGASASMELAMPQPSCVILGEKLDALVESRLRAICKTRGIPMQKAKTVMARPGIEFRPIDGN